MVLVATQRRADWCGVLRPVAVGVVSGTLAGLIAGVGARLAMRIVAIAIGEIPGFTPGGTLLIMAIGTTLGVVPGIVYALVRRWLPGPRMVRGFTFGTLLFVGFEVYPLIAGTDFTEPGIHPAGLRWGVFGALSVIYGLALGAVEAPVGRLLTAPRRDPYRAIAYVLLVLWGLVGSATFLALLANAELGLHIPGA
jgi:hypothetical protein